MNAPKLRLGKAEKLDVVTKQFTKTKSFNTNNQKYKKKQVQTNKRTLIFSAPRIFCQENWDEVRNENQMRLN